MINKIYKQMSVIAVLSVLFAGCPVLFYAQTGEGSLIDQDSNEIDIVIEPIEEDQVDPKIRIKISNTSDRSILVGEPWSSSPALFLEMKEDQSMPSGQIYRAHLPLEGFFNTIEKDNVYTISSKKEYVSEIKLNDLYWLNDRSSFIDKNSNKRLTELAKGDYKIYIKFSLGTPVTTLDLKDFINTPRKNIRSNAVALNLWKLWKIG